MLAATLKSLLSRKLRLILSGLAVVLGVMAVASALILSNTLTSSFDELFATINKDLDVQVTAKKNVDISEDQGGLPAPVPADVVDEVRGVEGVKKAEGVIALDGARVVGDNGKVIPSQGPPRLGINWVNDNSLLKITKGHAPEAEDQVAINAGLAKTGDFAVGDSIEVLTLEPKKTFTVSGIFEYSGGRPSLGGETLVAFTTPVAQQLMLGEKDAFSAVDVKAEDGVSQKELQSTLEAALGKDYVVKTGQQVSDDQSSDVQEFVSIIRYVLLGFAAVALFVGIFLILNTFSIIVAQRTKELALFRAMGASRSQVIGSVLLEALIIGLIASTLGLLAGFGIASVLKSLIESQNSAPLPGGMKVPAIAVIASYAVGIIVTLIAAVLPAWRASRIPPIAAMREAEDTQKPLTRLTVAGLIFTALGVVLVGIGLFGGASLWFLLGGILAAFIGVAMLTPFVATPVIDVVGRLFSWSLPGKLGRRNSSRNPRRTAITAAALMIGLALVTGVSIMGSSFKASFSKLIQDDVGAQLIIAGDGIAGGPALLPTYRPEVIDEARQLPEVQSAAALWIDAVQWGESTMVVAASDWGAMAEMFTIETTSGDFRTLNAGEVMMDGDLARDKALNVGDTFEIATQRGGSEEVTLVGIYEKTAVMNGLLLSVPDAENGFRSGQPNFGYVKVKNDDDVAGVQKQLDTFLKDDLEVSAQDRGQLTGQLTKQIDQLLVMVYILLGLAIVIAVLGIVNTLALSILERTRELGLLRAVGLTRMQTMRMVTVESIVISVFGALLGLIVGSALGVAVIKALENTDMGIDVLDFPWTRMIIFLVLAVVVGLFAAIIPAIRAARTNVLSAIAYE